MTAHPVQPTPPAWTPPAAYAAYVVAETVTIPLEPGGPPRTVTILEGPTGDVVALDTLTGAEVDRCRV